jgi:hypothetical protein
LNTVLIAPELESLILIAQQSELAANFPLAEWVNQEITNPQEVLQSTPALIP